MGFLRRRETAADDQARTGRLLQGLEDAYAARTGDPVDGGPLDEFEETVINAAAAQYGTPYPPAGHDYPRR
ncbi:hypothetical protein JL475_30590 [Streptomyces sp. M2CJ-2]|uniref:hypothetical protein n=1 Tax=Streptomyces sp. M2CJ-2 TaxID=2803948 RepID=UPI001927BA64|nr:hypothetical protein [Streptomyces sp. M2CJ-2]MBL3670248.1 hypothetical protein [Streptomyces sp. M2CJ-2]